MSKTLKEIYINKYIELPEVKRQKDASVIHNSMEEARAAVTECGHDRVMKFREVPTFYCMSCHSEEAETYTCCIFCGIHICNLCGPEHDSSCGPVEDDGTWE